MPPPPLHYPMLAQCLQIESADEMSIAAAASRVMDELARRTWPGLEPVEFVREAGAVEGAGALIALGRPFDALT